MAGSQTTSTGSNFRLDTMSFPRKWNQVRIAMEGDALFSYMVAEEYTANPKPPATIPARISVWIREHLGEHRETGFYYIFFAALLAAPWWWRSRAARFSLIFLPVTWLEMAVTQDAGASAHHVVLLWPFPILFVSVALASLPRRSIAIAIGIAMVAMNLLVDNQYITQFARNGPTGPFTDAIFPLSSSLPNDPIYVIDWGIYDSVNLLHRGRLNLQYTGGLLLPDSADEAERHEIANMLAEPASVFVTHVPEQEVFAKVGAHLEQEAQALGYRKELLRTVADSNGRPVFEVFRFVRS